MKRAEKIHLLSEALKGEISGLRSVKESRTKIGGVMLVDGMPDPDSDERVRVRYHLHDGTEHEEELNYAEIMARRNGEALVILPDNGRGKPFAARPYTISHTVIFEDYSERPD